MRNQSKDLYVDKLTYSWFLPELTIAAYCAGDKEFCTLIESNLSVQDKIEKLQIWLFGENDVRGQMLIFDKVVEEVFREPPLMYIGIDPYMYLYDKFPKIGAFKEYLRNETVDKTITGNPIDPVDSQYMFKYVQTVLADFTYKHTEGVTGILKEHYTGSKILSIGAVFEIVTQQKVLKCELENLIYSGSRFSCTIGDVQMLPIII